MSLSTLRKIDHRFIDTVYGYIRNQENGKMKIPDEIKHLCLDFYLLQQYFTDHDISQTIIAYPTGLDTDTRSHDVRNIKLMSNKVIDVDDTSIAKYVWKFKLLSFGTDVSFKFRITEIGLMTEQLYEYPNYRARTFEWKPAKYHLQLENKSIVRHRAFKKQRLRVKENDTITMVLDVERLALGFGIKSGEIKYTKDWAAEKREISYLREKGLKMMCILPVGASVELIEFYVEQKS